MVVSLGPFVRCGDSLYIFHLVQAYAKFWKVEKASIMRTPRMPVSGVRSGCHLMHCLRRGLRCQFQSHSLNATMFASVTSWNCMGNLQNMAEPHTPPH